MLFFKDEADLKAQMEHDIEFLNKFGDKELEEKFKRIYLERYGHAYGKKPPQKPILTVIRGGLSRGTA
jgi:hypothetical protein